MLLVVLYVFFSICWVYKSPTIKLVTVVLDFTFLCLRLPLLNFAKERFNVNPLIFNGVIILDTVGLPLIGNLDWWNRWDMNHQAGSLVICIFVEVESSELIVVQSFLCVVSSHVWFEVPSFLTCMFFFVWK